MQIFRTIINNTIDINAHMLSSIVFQKLFLVKHPVQHITCVNITIGTNMSIVIRILLFFFKLQVRLEKPLI